MGLLTTKRFEKDLKLVIKRDKDLKKLWVIVERLLAGLPLAAKHRSHKLAGNYYPAWEYHFEPDWLMIWDQEGDLLVLTRTDSHSDLF